jgi:hypothetical protein
LVEYNARIPLFRVLVTGSGQLSSGSASNLKNMTRPGRIDAEASRPTSRPNSGFVANHRRIGCCNPPPTFDPVPVPSHSFGPVPQFRSREAIRSAALLVAAYRAFVSTLSRSPRAHLDHCPSRKRPFSQCYRRKTDSPRPSFYALINNFESLLAGSEGARRPLSAGEERTLDR